MVGLDLAKGVGADSSSAGRRFDPCTAYHTNLRLIRSPISWLLATGEDPPEDLFHSQLLARYARLKIRASGGTPHQNLVSLHHPSVEPVAHIMALGDRRETSSGFNPLQCCSRARHLRITMKASGGTPHEFLVPCLHLRSIRLPFKKNSRTEREF